MADVVSDCKAGNIDICSEIIKRDPTNAFGYIWRGKGYYDRFVDKRAKERVIENLPPDQTKVLADLNSALADFDKAVEFDPLAALAYVERGIAYARRSFVYMSVENEKAFADQSKALANYNKAIEIDPKYAYAFVSRGIFYTELLHDYDKAIADYTTAIEINGPTDDLSYTSRAQAYEALGRKFEAIRDYSSSLIASPSNVDAREGLNRLCHAP